MKKKLSEVFNLKELEWTSTVPDASGVRGGVKWISYSRAQDFPYDDNNPDNNYGQPGVNKGSGETSAGHFSVVLPKDISHSSFDNNNDNNDMKKGFEDEAMGTPYFASGDQGGGGWPISGLEPWNYHPDEGKPDRDKQLAAIKDTKKEMTMKLKEFFAPITQISGDKDISDHDIENHIDNDPDTGSYKSSLPYQSVKGKPLPGDLIIKKKEREEEENHEIPSLMQLFAKLFLGISQEMEKKPQNSLNIDKDEPTHGLIAHSDDDNDNIGNDLF